VDASAFADNRIDPGDILRLKTLPFTLGPYAIPCLTECRTSESAPCGRGEK